ncbi:hypothetical protein ACFXKG_12920 [Streptomyces sp. NPDC059255]|uniref:hypothetical protein n=1 Tax=Streptomyces sp. NPDC059255 TaxID=3346793 RepID=UPI00368573D9
MPEPVLSGGEGSAVGATVAGSGVAPGTPAREQAAVDALLSLGGQTLPLLRQWVGSDPGSGVARALLALATCGRWDKAVLKEQLVIARRDALAAGEREVSLVYGVFLHTHRQYRLTADHLVGHFAHWPADEPAGLLLGAFHASGDAAYRAHGDALTEDQAVVAGPASWPWLSWLAPTPPATLPAKPGPRTHRSGRPPHKRVMSCGCLRGPQGR